MPRPTPSPTNPHPRRALATRLGFWALALSLTAGNAWWAWADRPAVPLKEAEAWLARGRLDDAERALRHRLGQSPEQGDARMALARLLAKRGDYLGSARQLHLVPDWWPSKAEAVFLEGQAYKLLNRLRDAEAAWLVLTADDPLHPAPPSSFRTATKELIANYVLEGRLDDARKAVWRAYDAADPLDRPAILVMRMRIELERIAHEEAVVKLRSYVAALPDDAEARRALALEELATGHPGEADRLIEACLRDRPDDAASWRARLEIDHQKGDRAALRTHLDRLPPAADADAEVWKFRGLAREWDGDLAGAAEAFATAAKLNPREGEYLYKLGIAEQRLGRTDLAREHTRQSRELRQADAQLHDAYREYLNTADKGGPDDPAFRTVVHRLASVCDRLGWAREAEAWRAVAPAA